MGGGVQKTTKILHQEDFSEDFVLNISKDYYNMYVKRKVELAAFHDYFEMTPKCQKKLGNLQYTALSIQPYMVSVRISMKEKLLLFSLRPKLSPAKINFMKQ